MRGGRIHCGRYVRESAPSNHRTYAFVIPGSGENNRGTSRLSPGFTSGFYVVPGFYVQALTSLTSKSQWVSRSSRTLRRAGMMLPKARGISYVINFIPQCEDARQGSRLMRPSPTPCKVRKGWGTLSCGDLSKTPRMGHPPFL